MASFACSCQRTAPRGRLAGCRRKWKTERTRDRYLRRCGTTSERQEGPTHGSAPPPLRATDHRSRSLARAATSAPTRLWMLVNPVPEKVPGSLIEARPDRRTADVTRRRQFLRPGHRRATHSNMTSTITIRRPMPAAATALRRLRPQPRPLILPWKSPRPASATRQKAIEMR